MRNVRPVGATEEPNTKAERTSNFMNGKLRMVSLQSGSNGNCVFVESQGVRLLFDAGISSQQTASRLDSIDVDIGSIDAVIISHAHSDHIRFVGDLQRKFGLSIWMTGGACNEAKGRKSIKKADRPNLFEPGRRLEFGPVAVETIATPHDTDEGVCFVVDDGSVRLGVMTDLGHCFSGLGNVIAGLDGLLLESNYDPETLETGMYPELLKRRIKSKKGHLSNNESAMLLKEYGIMLRWVCLGHLSEKNNRPEIAYEVHRKNIRKNIDIFLASRNGCSDIFEL